MIHSEELVDDSLAIVAAWLDVNDELMALDQFRGIITHRGTVGEIIDRYRERRDPAWLEPYRYLSQP